MKAYVDNFENYVQFSNNYNEQIKIFEETKKNVDHHENLIRKLFEIKLNEVQEY